MQPVVHYSLHLIFPAAIAYVLYKEQWRKVYLIFLLTMLVDLDHLFANPIFQADRCSIGFHPLHSYYAIAVYLLMLIPKNIIRIIAIGLLFHILTDLIDCLIMFERCPDCYSNSVLYKLIG